MPKSLQRILAAVIAAVFVIAAPVSASDWQKQAEQLRKSIAFVGIYDEEANLTGSCTAFSINDAKDYFLTAAHCYEGALKVDDKNAYVIYYDQVADLLVLVVPDSGTYPALKLATKVAAGEEVASYGWGYGLDFPTFRAGVVSTADVKFPQISAAYGYGGPDERYTLCEFLGIHGMSGGPVVDAQGNLVTIVQIGIPDSTDAGRSLSELTSKVGKYFTADK